MTLSPRRSVPWLLWPFALLWSLVTFVLRTVGRVLCAILGLALLAAGVALTMTFVGAILGVPLAVLGGLLLVRSVF